MENQQKNQKSKKEALNKYLQYSGIAFQMAAIIGIFTYAGTWCDSYFETTKPYFTVIFSLIGVAGGLYTSLKDFLK